jgi:VWFA-related protein
VLLLIDTGNQLGLKDTKLTRDVAMRVVSTLYPGTRIAIMQFAMKPELLQAWSTDKDAATRVLKTKLSWGKSSRLADAFAAAADQFNGTTPGTRHIVIITDGVEAPGGRVTMTSAIKQLNSVQASVHIISYTLMARLTLKGQTKRTSAGDGVQRDGNPASNPVANGDPTLPVGTTRTPSFKIGSVDLDVAMRRKRKEYERATQESEKRLTEVAEESGGQLLLPISGSDLMAQVETISRDIGSQYVVTYRPTHPLAEAQPGEYRRIEVASRRVGLYLRSRKGYVVPGGK